MLMVVVLQVVAYKQRERASHIYIIYINSKYQFNVAVAFKQNKDDY